MFDVKLLFNTKKLTKFYTAINEGADKYLRPELADGLDHSSRRFFKVFWETQMQGPPGVKAQPRGIFHHFYRWPRGGVSGQTAIGRPIKATQRAASVRTFIQSRSKTMNMGIELFTDSVIAKAHALGEVRTSKKGGKLAVPMPPNIQPFMYTSRGQLKPRYKNPSGLNLVPVRLSGDKGSQTYLCKRYKKSGKINAMYVLKNNITVKKRLRYYELFDEMRPQFRDILDKSFRKGLKAFRAAI